MQGVQTTEIEPQRGERRCLQCEMVRPLLAFSRYKGRVDEYRQNCCECEQSNQQKRHHRLENHREMWQQQKELEERKRQEWERKIAARQVYEQRQQEREDWYVRQSDRRCRMC